MKKYSFFNFLILICFLGLISCAPKDDPIDIETETETETTEPIDSMDTTGGNPGPNRTYSTESYSVGDWGVEIYIPSDYDSLKKYPVLYFNDGDLYANVFGFLTSADAPAFIMVGISGENDRGERFSAYSDPDLGSITPSATIYSDAIIDDILPFVENKFTIDRNKRAIFGISLGGLHATWIAIKYPQVFSFVGAISPSYWVGNEAIFEENLSDLSPPGLSRKTKIYFDRGSAEWRNHLSFVSRLQSAGLIYGRSLFYYEVIGADHTPEDWQLRIEIPFRIFLEGIGLSSEPNKLELHSYCARDITNNNAKTTRLNPIIHYENGVKFSIISEAEYDITQGNGSIDEDGTYNISSGSSMTVEATYLDLTDVETLTDCN